MKPIRRRQSVETTERINKTAERLAKTSADSYKMVIDHVVARQERNVRFAQEIFGDAVREIRHQAESNKVLTRELVERAETQRDDLRTLVGESIDAYTDLLYAPLAYYKQGLRLVESEGFPIAGYDELNVKEIGDRLDGMTAAEIRTVREYEKRNKNRETLIDQFDRKLKAASA
jgi:predicted DNA-binding protein